MVAFAASLVALTLAADATWSIVVTRTGHVAAPEVLVNSLAEGVGAQSRCALGAYTRRNASEAPLKPGEDLAECNTADCLARLAHDMGVERLVALRLNQGLGTILVQTSVVEPASGALVKIEATEVAEGALEGDARRLAEAICSRLPSVEEPASPKVLATAAPLPRAADDIDTWARTPEQRRFGHGVVISAGVAASALVASGVFMGMGARQTTIVRTLQPGPDRDAAISFGNAMNIGAYASGSVLAIAAGVGAALWFFEDRAPSGQRPHLSLGVLPGGGAYGSIQVRY